MRAAQILATCGLTLTLASAANAQEIDWKKVDAALGKTATVSGEVHCYGFPRSDLQVTVDGIAIKPALALGGWAAFMPMRSEAMVMGDLVLLETEVNPVMAKLLEGGIDITAVHNHLLRANPETFYMHIGGRDPITEGGMTVPTAMGSANAINFQPTGGSKAAITGDFVITGDEVNPMIKTLRASGIEVTALHSHMLTEQPRVFFMHFWANDDALKLAKGVRAALDKTAAVKS
jgi:Domain of Unknown Function (DUF1259)